MTKFNFTSINVLLDRSGSMSSILDDTIGGFNQFLSDQKALEGEAVLSLIQFDHEYEVIHNVVSLKEAPLLTKETYKPRGATALLDSLAKMINSTGKSLSEMKEEDRPSKVVFVVITDGHENCSVEFNKKIVYDMIVHQKTKYNWDFVYLCADESAISDAISYGFDHSGTVTYTKSKRGARSAFKGLSNCMASYRSAKDKLDSKGFFKGSKTIAEDLVEEEEDDHV